MFATRTAPVVLPNGCYQAMIPIAKLRAHPKRQRAFSLQKAKRMFAARGGFDAELAGPIDVAPDEEIPGGWLICSGQHRVRVAEWDGFYEVFCTVHPNLTPQDQARFFLGTTVASPPSLLEAWHIRREEKDPLVLDVEAVLNRYDITVAKVRNPTEKGRHIAAVKVLEKIATPGGGLVRLNHLLKILVDAFPSETPLNDWALGGLEYFLWAYEQHPNFDDHTLIDGLSRLHPSELERLVHYHKANRGGIAAANSRQPARAFLDVYNKRKRINRLPYTRVEVLRKPSIGQVLPYPWKGEEEEDEE